MARIEELLAEQYPDAAAGQPRVERFFSDAMCWCRNNREWPVALFNDAWRKSGFDIPDDYLGVVVGMHHPNFVADEDEPDPLDDTDSNFSQFSAAGEARCVRLSEQVDVAADASVRDRVVSAVAQCCTLLSRRYDVMDVTQLASLRYMKADGKTRGIFPDEDYSRDELGVMFEDETIERIFNDLGASLDPNAIVSGADVSKWVRKNLPFSSESDAKEGQ